MNPADYAISVTLDDGSTKTLYTPQPKQIELHTSPAPNILYGGAAGGMKSHGLRWHGIMACLKFTRLKVLLLRREFKELKPTHLLKIGEEVPPQVGTYHSSDHHLKFPGTGSAMWFGHCNTDADFNAYLSTEWDMILIDEAGEFSEYQLRLLPSRLRTSQPITPQFVLASNPGGPGHTFLKSRFITKLVSKEDDPEYVKDEYHFIRSLVSDTPVHFVGAKYIRRLRSLPEAQRKAFLLGDWDAFAGQFFSEWYLHSHVVRMLREAA